MPHSRPGERVELARQLGLFDSTMVIAGIVIGSGIFLTTGLMAREIPSAPLILLAWLIGGLHALAGALTYAELGASMPHAGGQYVYLREAYGPFVGFLFGWVSFLVYLTGIIAALGVAFAEYFGYFFPLLSTDRIFYETDVNLFGWSVHYAISNGHLVGIGLIAALSLLNYLGVVFGKLIQNITTLIKIGSLLVFILLSLFSPNLQSIEMTILRERIPFETLLIGFGVALISVSWTIAGWEEISFVAGEIRDPAVVIPRALALGVGCVTVIYFLMNYIYLSVLPVEEIAGVTRVGEVVSSRLFGASGAGLLSAAITISVLGAMNGTVLVGPRVYYAMALDGLFFRSAGQVHSRFRTPGRAIVIQAVWASVLTLSGTFEDLITFVVFANLMLWIAGAAAVFTLRKKFPDLPRPYTVWGYPYLPLLFILVSTGIMLNMLWETPAESMAGIGLTLIGAPVYFFWRKKATAH